jgi:hypothetical protein
MSPTYWTATQIISAAQAHGWEIIPCQMPDTVWAIRKGCNKVQIQERRDGGLSWVSLTYPMSDGVNCDYYGPRARGKLQTVLEFLYDCPLDE